MNKCDGCQLILEEDCTHERILCTKCMGDAAKIYCVKCKSVMKWYNYLKFTGDGFREMRPIFFVIAALSLFDLIFFFFNHDAGFKIAVGLVAMTAVIVAVISLVYILVRPLFMWPYYLGSWINEKFDWDIGDIDDGPIGLVRWLIGVVLIGCPYIFYLAGSFVWKHLLGS